MVYNYFLDLHYKKRKELIGAGSIGGKLDEVDRKVGVSCGSRPVSERWEDRKVWGHVFRTD